MQVCTSEVVVLVGNARFSTTNGTSTTQLLGAYTTNFGTMVFQVLNNKTTEVNLGANRTDGFVLRR